VGKARVSELRMIKRCAEFLKMDQIKELRPGTRGIYVLLKKRNGLKRYDVVYIGMAGGESAGSVRSRLQGHRRSKRKDWTHFSVFQVWENIREEEIRELEGLFRHIYRYDTKANKLNKQRGFKKLGKVLNDDVRQWG
jgi:hypothetical protein